MFNVFLCLITRHALSHKHVVVCVVDHSAEHNYILGEFRVFRSFTFASRVLIPSTCHQ